VIGCVSGRWDRRGSCSAFRFCIACLLHKLLFSITYHFQVPTTQSVSLPLIPGYNSHNANLEQQSFSRQPLHRNQHSREPFPLSHASPTTSHKPHSSSLALCSFLVTHNRHCNFYNMSWSGARSDHLAFLTPKVSVHKKLGLDTLSLIPQSNCSSKSW
jgi:hypothetical protein